MPSQFTNLLELQRFFTTELICVQYLEQSRWKGQPHCPHCLSEHHYRTKTRLKSPELKDYKDFRCKACDKKYTVLTGTIYESSKIELKTWFAAVYLCTAHKKGVSSHQLARDLGVTQKTAWFLEHRIRAMLSDSEPTLLEGTIEADETYHGGKEGNKHQSIRAVKQRKNAHAQRKENGRGVFNKTPMLGAVQRDGKIILKAVDSASSSNIHRFIKGNVKKGSNLITDEFKAYVKLGIEYNHESVNHALKEYGRGDVHTNTIEGAWSLLKRGIYGIYHSVSKTHLQAYCDEFAYRYNTRKIKDADRFVDAIEKTKNARLKYKELTRK